MTASLSALQEKIDALNAQIVEMGAAANDLAQSAAMAINQQAHSEAPFFVHGLTIFILAVFVGYYVVWKVTPALHSPLMAVTNAVSSVIIVGALIATGPLDFGFSSFMGFLAVLLAAVNIFGGFIVTERMLHMYKKKGK